MRKFIQSAVLGKMLLAAAFCTATLFPFAGWAVDVYPFPGVSISPDSAIPSDGHGVVLFDLGLPVTERSSVYGLSVSLGGSGYNDTLVGGQVGLVGWAKNAYGAQLGFSNSAEKGVGVQVGILNFYNDVLDENDDGETAKIQRPNGWPRRSNYPNSWLHSDMKDMSYFYNHKFYEKVKEKGGLQ